MVNKQKRKGTDWERKAAKVLNRKLSNAEFKRVPGSGALGTIMDESRLSGDIKGKIPFLEKRITMEAKTGYGGHKQLTLKRKWLNKIRKEAEASYSIPMLICKFAGARTGAKHFVVLDIDAFVEVINEANKLYDDFVRLQEEVDDLRAQLEESKIADTLK